MVGVDDTHEGIGTYQLSDTEVPPIGVLSSQPRAGQVQIPFIYIYMYILNLHPLG